jgi:protein-arginine kinase activator protein McsA
MDQPSDSPAVLINSDITSEKSNHGADEDRGAIALESDEKQVTNDNSAASASGSDVPVENVPLDFDPQSVMEWEAGVGKLPDSNLKFKQVQNGFEMIDEEEAVKIQQQEQLQQSDATVKTEPADPQSSHSNSNSQPVSSSSAAAEGEMRTCVHCSKTGPLKNFIRAGKFCSQDCATSQASQLKSLVKSLDVNSYDVNRNGKMGLKQEGRIRHSDSSPQPEKRKHMMHEDSPAGRSRRRDDENDENNRSRQRPDSLLTGKLKGGRKKNRVKEIRNEETTSLIDSEKLSLPSSPSSSLVHITPQSALHQSIFSMRVLQHQQEPPLEWDRHSKNLLPLLSSIRPPEVLSWDPEQVAAFVNTIPGCRDIGQTFAEEVSLSLVSLCRVILMLFFEIAADRW